MHSHSGLTGLILHTPRKPQRPRLCSCCTLPLDFRSETSQRSELLLTHRTHTVPRPYPRGNIPCKVSWRTRCSDPVSNSGYQHYVELHTSMQNLSADQQHAFLQGANSRQLTCYCRADARLKHPAAGFTQEATPPYITPSANNRKKQFQLAGTHPTAHITALTRRL